MREGLRKLFKSKITWVVSGIIILIIVLVSLFLVFGSREIKELKTNTYTMYVKTNKLSKLTFEESYYECKKRKEIRVCSDYSYEVKTYEYLDGSEKLDLKDKDIIEALKDIYDKSKEEDYSYIKLITDWDNKYSESEIKSKIEASKEVVIVVDKELDEKKIIEEETKEEVKEYVVKFDTDGGSIVNSQLVKDKGLVVKPEEPTKEGYKFKEWQLNGEVYDFNKEVADNITLKAIWEKVESSKPNNPSKPNTGGNAGGSQGGSSSGNTGNKPEEKPKPDKKLVYVKEAEEVKSCSSGYTLENGKCVRKSETIKKRECTEREINGKCYMSYAVYHDYTCDGNDQYEREFHSMDLPGNGWIYNFCKRESSGFSYFDTYPAHVAYSCPWGGVLSGYKCLEEIKFHEYEECSSGWDLIWDTMDVKYTCVQKSEPTISYTCGNLIKQDNKCYRYE